MNPYRSLFFFRLIRGCIAVSVALALANDEATGARIRLKNGVALNGEIARIGSLVVDPNASSVEDGGSILLIDDDLRRTYVPVNQIREVTPDVGQDTISFEIPHQPVAQQGNPLIALGPVLNRGEQSARWDNFGRRTIEISLPH